MFNCSPSFARAFTDLRKAWRTVWYINTFVRRISEMRVLFKCLVSYMTSLLKFMHLGKHCHFPCLLVSKFLMSNPNNVNLESEVKSLSCQLTHTSNSVCVWQRSQKVGSDGNAKAGGWFVHFNKCRGFFFPHIQNNTNWSLIPALWKSSKPKQGNPEELTFGVTDGVAAAPHHISELVWHSSLEQELDASWAEHLSGKTGLLDVPSSGKQDMSVHGRESWLMTTCLKNLTQNS